MMRVVLGLLAAGFAVFYVAAVVPAYFFAEALPMHVGCVAVIAGLVWCAARLPARFSLAAALAGLVSVSVLIAGYVRAECAVEQVYLEAARLREHRMHRSNEGALDVTIICGRGWPADKMSKARFALLREFAP